MSKIIQLAVTYETRDSYSTLFCLTEDGEIYFKIDPTSEKEEWHILDLPDELTPQE